MKKLFQKSLLVAAGLLVGASAWADATSIYERGTTTAWSANDLNDWTLVTATSTAVDGGIVMTGTNAGYSATKTIAVTENSIVTLKATMTGGVAPGRDTSYDYITIGGISLKLNGQSQKATIDVDGTATNLTGFSRGGTYNVTFVIDQATGSVSYTVSGASTGSGTAVSNTAITNVVVGHNRGGRENYATTVKLVSIEVSEEVQTVTTANYTLNYVAGGETVKSEVLTGVVGNDITLTDGQKANFTKDDVTYIYDNDDSEGKTVAADGSTVVTLNYHAAANWAYSVVSNLGTSIATGTVVEGSSIQFGYPQYINNEGTLYEAPKSMQGSAGYYLMNFTPTKDNDVFTVNYTETSIQGVVFYTEAEDIEGITKNNGGNANIRCSGAWGGYAENEVKLTTLPAGRYHVYGQVWGNSGNTFRLTADGKTIWEKATVGYLDNASAVFDFAEETDIMIPAAGSNGKVMDFFYIRKLGEHIANMSIIGDFTETAWDEDQELAMTQDLDDQAVWTLVVEDFVAESKEYQYKARANHNWTDYILPAGTDNKKISLTAGTYKLTFTVNTTKNELTLVAEKQVDYTVVGCFNEDNTASFFGTSWDVANNDNNLVSNGDGTYSKTFYNVALEAGTIKYKVVEGHSWDAQWGFPASETNPNGNADYIVNEAGTYDITFTFNPIEKFGNGYNVDCKVIATPATVAKTISAAGYATYCSPYALDFSAVTGLKAYIATQDGDSIKFVRVNSVPAGTGVLLKGEGEYNINVVASAEAVEGNLFVGVLADTKVAAGNFVLMNGNDGVGFYKTTKEFTVGANTAYLEGAAGGARMFIGFDENTTTTAINAVAAEQMNGEVYNLKGQRVAQPSKGLYIVNGKKVVLK